MEKNEISKSESKENKNDTMSESEGKNVGKKQPEIMMSELLSAISETEYPDYIIEAANIVQNWMNDAINKSKQEPEDKPTEIEIFSEFFGSDFTEDETGSIEDLYSRLSSLEEFADVIPNSKKSNNKSETIIISLASPDYEGGLRAAIDHAAIFSRGKCRRVWIISDAFVLDEVVRFMPYVDALAEQNITLRFLLVTAWGWVELPLSGATASRQQFLWRADEIKTRAPKRRKKQ
ncbi:MAG: hypothetical protein IJ597_07280 [Synergistaceae bacterium]|nr:hypothetical protein [Synergistaceae bacterium]